MKPMPTSDHKPGRIGAHECPTRKWVYEEEQHAVRALRWMREHGEIRRGSGYVYPCPKGKFGRHWHVTGRPKLRTARKTERKLR